MKITTISASFGFTKNLGNYQTLRADATVTAEINEDENADDAFKKAFELAKEQVSRETGGK